MRDRRVTTLKALREAVDCLPRATRLAMLDGINRHPIIVGAYTDEAGICPMLAAHRGGGRTSFIGFAKAWDSFAFQGSRHRRSRRARRATDRELLVLRTYLKASLLEDAGLEENLEAAATEHRALLIRRGTEARPPAASPAAELPARTQAPPGDPDRTAELRREPGWRWMRVVRSLDEYERALRALQHQPLEAEGGDGPARRTPVSA
jgi:hypothetical protein